MYTLVCLASVAVLIANSHALLVAVLRISYGKFTWALVGSLLVAMAAALALRWACASWTVLPEALHKAFVPLAVLLSLGIPFLVEAARGQRKG